MEMDGPCGKKLSYEMGDNKKHRITVKKKQKSD